MLHRVQVDLTGGPAIRSTVLRYDILARLRRCARRSRVDVLAFGLAAGRARLVTRGTHCRVRSFAHAVKTGTRRALPPGQRRPTAHTSFHPLPGGDLPGGIAWAHAAVLCEVPSVLRSPWSSHRDLLGFRRAHFYDAKRTRRLVDPAQVHRHVSAQAAPVLEPAEPDPGLHPDEALHISAAVHGVLPGHWSSRRTAAHMLWQAGYGTAIISDWLGISRRRSQQLLQLPAADVQRAWASVAHPDLRHVP